MLIDAIPHEFLTSDKITLDYLNRANRTKQVFPKHFKDLSMREFSVNRQKLVGRLLDSNKELGAPEQVIRNIEALSQPETYAVITGQQPGIFSGPLYTVYKAITTIIICERLADRGLSLVPIFWNASEDHDLHEIDCISIFKQNEPVEILYKCELEGVAFSHISVDKSELKRILKIVDDNSPDSEFKEPLLKKIDRIIDESSNLGDFFSRFMLNLFGDLGLITIEPDYLRDMMAPIFERLIRNPTECTRIITQASTKLKDLGYSPRIHKKPNLCNFFVLNEAGERLRVTYNGKFQVGTEEYSQGDLLGLLDEDPSKFSSNAVIRPITQDYIFPTFAYVSGPNEIAYQAQLGEVYDFLCVEMPLIFPRFGATIVEAKVSKVFDKYGIDILELREPERLLKKIVGEGLGSAFKEFEDKVVGGINDVTDRVRSVDETLVEPCSVAETKILKAIRRMENKILSELKKRDRVAKQQIFKAYNNLFPNGGLQERHITVLEYLVKFGDNFLKVLHDDFSKGRYGEHRVIRC